VDFRTQPWDTAYLQAATDQFDYQSTIVRKMGFSNTISREQLQDSQSKFYSPSEPELNYLGYSDAPLKPYIKDIRETARDKGHRFFTSVLTSTTHYPWVLPPALGEPNSYMGGKGWVNHKMMNDYLNTIKYTAVWLAEIMDILEDTGVADENLVVVAGDQ
jgi:phosphoglycerol transferase MdoB-like AlkP superfamily enzyme